MIFYGVSIHAMILLSCVICLLKEAHWQWKIHQLYMVFVSMMMFVAMFHQQNQAAANHWLISYSLSIDLNIKSPHPNFSEINTTTTSSKISNNTSIFLVVLEAIALLIVASVFPTGRHLRVGVVSQKQLHSFGSDLEKLPTIHFQVRAVFREGNKAPFFGQKPLLVSHLFQRMVIFHRCFLLIHTIPLL